MLDISKNKIKISDNYDKFKSVRFSSGNRRFFSMNKFIITLTIVIFIILFLPWTQFINGKGNITTLRPDQRPQTIHSTIAGKVEKWYVQEGDFVEKGDTIMFISEIKDNFFDPNLLERTATRVQAKSFSFESYKNKVNSLDYQIQALKDEQELKLEQAKNKLTQATLLVKSDSIDLEAAKTQVAIAERQFERISGLEEEGLKSVADVEEKKMKYQESLARVISQENNLLGSRNKVINAQLEISSIKASYRDKIAKAESDRFSALSGQFEAEAQLNQLQNQFTNFEVRKGLNYIVAPQDGYINRAIQRGLGETFQEGAEIASIMPSNADLAVETFVDPIDLPLIHTGEKVRIIFDGWPYIFFSGWPNLSYGTFGGEIVAVERYISKNGKYRVLVAPDPDEQDWPEALRAGTGARTFALLNNVPVWYEIWRQINGFPPDYYTPEDSFTNSTKTNTK
ncbi:MAG: HlyD family secretion protein [Bacteroidota bacterium]